LDDDYDYEVFCLAADGNPELLLYFPESVISVCCTELCFQDLNEDGFTGVYESSVLKLAKNLKSYCYLNILFQKCSIYPCNFKDNYRWKVAGNIFFNISFNKGVYIHSQVFTATGE